MTSAPAGWYADPAEADSGRDVVRYWDGVSWTHHVAAKQTGASDKDRIEWLALVLSIFPLIGIVGGFVSMVKGHHLTGALMMAVGCTSAIAFSLLR